MRPPFLRSILLPAAAAVFFVGAERADAQHTAARQWNELLLDSIRNDFARPTVHARNLYHTSVAMWDAWATYSGSAQQIIFKEDNATLDLVNVDNWRSEALSHAVYHILRARFATSPGAPTMFPQYDALMTTLGYDKDFTSTLGSTPAAIGNRIAVAVLAFGLNDLANEQGDYTNQHYEPINEPLVPALPGNPAFQLPGADPNRWQPLALDFFIDQSGNVIIGGFPEFLSPEWGAVTPFSLSLNDLTLYERDGYEYWVYKDPGAPPLINTPTADHYKWGYEMVAVWSGHLDPSDGVMIDISPGSIGNGGAFPDGYDNYANYYDFFNGGDPGMGHPINPATGQPYPPQMVPRADYARVLAEFWADGPDSETPPGHWFSILNYVSDHPQFTKQLGGEGPVLNDLEWDVKSYLAMGGAMHDCAVAAWGVKGWYDYPRPISALRYMADLGQSSDPNLPSYDPNGIRLYPGVIELVTAATTALGQKHDHLAGNEGKIALFAWRGPDFIINPDTDVAGCDWILAENWWPYQRPTFVTPPFAGFVSGHSTYSRAAAVVMDRLTGSPFFPGGVGEFFCAKNQFLVFEDGPSVDLTLQWATYYDASDQTSLSRIWGGIHPPADDIPGRIMGQEIGEEAFALAVDYFNGTACDIDGDIYLYGSGCPGGGDVVPKLSIDGCPTPGGDMTLVIDDGAPQALGLLLIGAFEAEVPVAGSCTLNVAPAIAAFTFPLGGTPGVDGSGSLTADLPLAPNTPLSTLKLQAFIADNAIPWGYAATNGLSLRIE